MTYFSNIICILSLSIIVVAPDLRAEILKVDSSTKEPAAIEADNMTYDYKTQTVSANGKVEVTQGDYQLKADSISYNQNRDELSATNHITLKEPNGTVIFADHVLLRDTLSKGDIEKPKAQFVDQSHASADNAIRLDKDTIVLHNATYSACPICKPIQTYDAKTDKAPMWQIRSKKTTFNQKEERVSYRDATFEVYGIPIAYTPYFSHATPNAQRKSGFLIPKYQSDSNLGTMVSLPYYYSIASNKDLTLTPTFASNVEPILAGEYRHLLEHGYFSFEGSITNPKEIDEFGNETSDNDIRGHIEGEGHFNITDDWTTGFDVQRATDDTYLRKYQYSDADTLTSRGYVNYEKQRNFFKAETLSFQGLQASDDPGLTPLILPHLQGKWEMSPGIAHSVVQLTGDLLSLSRSEGTSTNRASVTAAWDIPYITRQGHVFKWSNSLRADSYLIDDISVSNGTTEDDSITRFIPQSQLTWTYPVVTQRGDYRILLEPTVDFIVSPYGNNPENIQNEDSQDIEFSDVNLFSTNHFTGLDYVEEGARSNYGAKLDVDHPDYGYASVFLGQSYRFSKNERFDAGSGLEDNQSDIVGRLAYSYQELFNISYQFRMNASELATNSNLVHMGIDTERFNLSLNYLSLDEQFDNTLANTNSREYIVANSSLALTDRWSIEGMGNRDLEQSSWRSARGNLIYQGECVSYTLGLGREFTRDRDIEPNTSITFQVSLRNLTR